MNVHEALSTLKDEAKGDEALKLLHIASYFAPNKIEMNLFSDLLCGTQSLNNAVELMVVRSLLQYADEEAFIIIIGNDVREEVQTLLRHGDKEESVLNVAIELLDKHLTSGRCGILDHAMSVFNATKAYPELLMDNSKFPTLIIEGLLRKNRYTEAEAFCREALEVLQGFIGAYHESTCQVQRQLGLVLLYLNRIDESLTMLSESYQKTSVALGHSPMNQTLDLIAMVTANYTSEPESRLRRLVFGDVSLSETNNNTHLSRWCEYATVLLPLKWKDEAMPILNQVLKKRLELLRPDDDDICRVEELVAQVHMKRKEYREALEVYRRVYEKRKLALSENCIRTLDSRRGVGLAFEALGMLDEAVAEFEAVAAGIRRIKGNKAVAYLITRSKIAYILCHQKKFERAYDIFTRLHTSFVKVFGEKDILTLNIKYNVGRVLLSQNKLVEVLTVLKELLPKYIEVLGPRHSYTLSIAQEMQILAIYHNAMVNQQIM